MKVGPAEQRTGLKLVSRQSNRSGNSDLSHQSHACCNDHEAPPYQCIMAKDDTDFNASRVLVLRTAPGSDQQLWRLAVRGSRKGLRHKAIVLNSARYRSLGHFNGPLSRAQEFADD
jgi:hypothetical protein